MGDTPNKAAAGLHRWLEKETNDGCYSDIHYGASLNDHIFHDLEIHLTGETITAEQARQLFVVPALSESLHDSHDSTENNDNDTDDNEEEELDQHEYESDFEDAGKTSEEEDKALMVFALLLIKQRLLLIYLTTQAKRGQSEQLQLNKKNATKSLMKRGRRYERIENLMEQYEAPHVPVEGVQHSDNEDEDQVPTAQESLATKLAMIATQITTPEEQVQVEHGALKITKRDMSLMKEKLLDTKSIEASLMEHAGKLLRWHNQPKIERSTVLKAAYKYERQALFHVMSSRACQGCNAH